MSVYLIHGDKGGVGKSTFAATLTEYLIARGKHVALVDTDLRNADLATLYDNVPEVEMLIADPRQHQGWLEVATALDRFKANDVVISLPGNIGADVTAQGDYLSDALKELQRSLVVFWLLNRTPYSVALLQPTLETFAPTAKAIVAVRNCYFGDPDRFERWNTSKTRTAFFAAGGSEIDLLELHAACFDATFGAHPARRFSDGDALSYGERLTLRRWFGKMLAIFDTIAERIGVGQR